MKKVLEKFIKGEPFWADKLNDIVDLLNEEFQMGAGSSSGSAGNDGSGSIDIDSSVSTSIPDLLISGKTMKNLAGSYALFNSDRLSKFEYLGGTRNEDDGIYISFSVEPRSTGTILISKPHEIKQNFEIGKMYVMLIDYSVANINKNEIQCKFDVTNATALAADSVTSNINKATTIFGLFRVSDEPVINIVCKNNDASNKALFKLTSLRIYEVNEKEMSKIMDQPLIVPSLYSFIVGTRGVINPTITANDNILNDATWIKTLMQPTDDYDVLRNRVVYNNIEGIKIATARPIPIKMGTYKIAMLGDISINTGSVEVYKIVAREVKPVEIDDLTKTFTMEEDSHIYVVYIPKNMDDIDEALTSLVCAKSTIAIYKKDSIDSVNELSNSSITFNTELHNNEAIFKSDSAYVKYSNLAKVEVDKVVYSVEEFDTSYKKIKSIDPIFGRTTVNLEMIRSFNGRNVLKITEATDIYKNVKGSIYMVENTDGYLELIISNDLSGWGDGYLPDNDEIKAFLLGWRLQAADGGSYTTGIKAWVPIHPLTSNDPFTAFGDVWTTSEVSRDECPKELSDSRFEKLSLMYRKDKVLTSSVTTTGLLIVKKSSDIRIKSGYIRNEALKVPSLLNSGNVNLGTDVNTKYNIMTIKSITTENLDMVDYMLDQKIDHVIDGEEQASFSMSTDRRNVLVSYIAAPYYCVSSYEVSMTVAGGLKDTILKIMKELQNIYVVGVASSGGGNGNGAVVSLHNSRMTGVTQVQNLAIDLGGVLMHGDNTIIDETGIVYRLGYNDLAELFPISKRESNNIEYGDIIAWSDDDGVVKATEDSKNKVVGVCSDTYGICLGGKTDEDRKTLTDFVPVGLCGRVNVKVTGDINPGDMITSSNIPGVGKKSEKYEMGTVIGKALRSHRGNTIDRIPIIVMNL